MNDWELLRAYADGGSEDAFRELVNRHLDLVLAAARRQVEDAHLAEDIAQAVFLVLARQAPHLRPDTVLPGWLWRTTRFVAARARRGELRRQRREQHALAMNPPALNTSDTPDPAPWLDAALATLNETDRNAVLLHYTQDRTLREVGARLGLSEEAAKKRVSRALDKLRAVLARRGITVSITVVTAALMPRPTNAAAGALAARITEAALQRTVASAAGGLAAALARETLAAWNRLRLFKAALGVGLALVVGTAVFVSSRNSIQPAKPTVASTSPSRPVGMVASSQVVSGTAALSSPWPGGGEEFRFAVVDRDSGAPAPQVHLIANAHFDGHWVPHLELRTGENGVAMLTLPAVLDRLDIGVLEDGWAARYATFRPHAGDPVPASYTLRARRLTNTFGGWIRQVDGRPVEGADILFNFDNSGDASSRETPRERDGVPIWNAPVAKSGPDGRWFTGKIAPEATRFFAEVRHPDFLATGLLQRGQTLDTALRGELVTIVERGFTLSGRVLDAAGAPVAQAVVSDQPFAFGAKPVLTDAEGRFEFQHLEAGTFTFSVTADTFSPQVIEAQVGGTKRDLEVRLRPGGLLRLRAVDPQGVEIPGVTFGLEAWGNYRHQFRWTLTTGTDGRAESRSAPWSGEMEFYAKKDGWCYTRDLRFQAGEEEHTVTLRRIHQVRVNALDALTGEPLGTFKAFPGYGEGDDQWERLDTRRTADGQALVQFSEARIPWRLRVEADEYEPAVAGPIEVSLPETVTVRLDRRNPAYAIHGTLLRPDGTPAADCQIALLTLEHDVTLGRNGFVATEDDAHLKRSDLSGRFTFAADAQAHSVVACSPDGFAQLRVADPRQAVTIRLQPWGGIEGDVDRSCRVDSDSTIQLNDPTAFNYRGRLILAPAIAGGHLDEHRRFVLERVPPGSWTLSISPGVGRQNHDFTAVEITPGELTSVTIKPAGPRLRGRVIATKTARKAPPIITDGHLILPNPAAHPTLSLDRRQPFAEVDYWQSPLAREALRKEVNVRLTIRPDGTFETQDGVPPGAYELRFISADRILTRRITVELPATGAAEVDLGGVVVPAGEDERIETTGSAAVDEAVEKHE